MIGADLAALETFHAAGLRSLGPVWSRNLIFGHGVPFAFPMGPDTGPGLTEAGFDLTVRECNSSRHSHRRRPHYRRRVSGTWRKPPTIR